MTKNERDEAIRVIKSECYISNLLNLDRTRMVNTALDMAVEALQSNSERWVPVNERLPERATEVLVTVRYKYRKKEYVYVDLGRLYGDKNHGWWCASDEYKIDKGREEIIAWMPFPKPYKAESEDKA